jgi:hypothetical protein
VDAIAKRSGQRTDIAVATADDRPPLGLSSDLEQAMVLEETQQRISWVVGREPCARGPDRGDHGHQVVSGEGLRKPVLGKQLRDRYAWISRAGENLPTPSPEADNINQHSQMCGRKQQRSFGKERIQATRRVFDVRVETTDRERHLARLCLYRQFVEEPSQERVGFLVENDEAGVEGKVAAVEIVHHRVRVTAQTRPLFEDVDIVLPVEQPSCSQTRNPASDHGDLHRPPFLGPTDSTALRSGFSRLNAFSVEIHSIIH